MTYSSGARFAHQQLAALRRHRLLRRDELIESGMSSHAITAAVRDGRLIRVRRGIYARPDAPTQIIGAVHIGGQLTCLSLLRSIGVFVHDVSGLHVHVPASLSRSRCRRPDDAMLHWDARVDGSLNPLASLRDAVRHSIRCQKPRAAIATLDSVLHCQLLTREELDQLFAELPRRYLRLLALVDASAESGPETYMRLILRSLGLRFETQVWIPGVGRVDFVVEGWLIIECDSRAFHQGWDKQVDDRHRDTAAASLGYITIRPLASALLDDTSSVRKEVQAVIVAFSARLTVQVTPQLRKTGAAAARIRRDAARFA